MDVDGDGTIDFYEYVMLMARQMKDNDSNEAMIEAFSMFDLDGDGFITGDELRHMMTGMGEKLTHEEVDEIIKEADTNGDGKIDVDEFISMMTPANREMPPLAKTLHVK